MDNNLLLFIASFNYSPGALGRHIPKICCEG